jgi:hypothetical protein
MMTHQKSTDLITSEKMNQFMSPKVLSIPHSFAMRLLCVELMLMLVAGGLDDPVWIYDNEPRNREIVNRISKTIDAGDSVVIWPDTIDEKDINDMILSGLDVQSVIELNTYSGLEAKLKFTYLEKNMTNGTKGSKKRWIN